MTTAAFGRDPQEPGQLRVMLDGKDLKWRWRLSHSEVAVDWLFEQLHALWAKVRDDFSTPGFPARFHDLVTAMVQEHLVPGDSGYKRPSAFVETEQDKIWLFEEKRSPGIFIQLMAAARWQHEREARWLRHEIKMLRRQLAKNESGEGTTARKTGGGLPEL